MNSHHYCRRQLSIDITYQLRRRDLLPTIGWCRRFYRAEPAISRFNLMIVLIMLSCICYLVWSDDSYYGFSSPAFWHQMKNYAFASGFSLTTGLITYLIHIGTQPKRKGYVSISPDTLFHRGRFMRLSLRWKDVQVVALELDGISFYGPRTPRRIQDFRRKQYFELSSVVHIPYHAFGSRAEREEFSALVQRHWEAARFQAGSSAAEQIWPPAPHMEV